MPGAIFAPGDRPYPMNPALAEPLAGPRLEASADASSRLADPVELARAQAAAFKRLLEVQAALVDAQSHRQAAARLVEQLARLLRYDEVAVAFLKGGRLQDVVRSGGAPADPSLPDVRSMLAVMHEALDQRASVATPAPLSEALPRIRAAQDRLLEEQGGSVACVLLSRPAEEGLDDRDELAARDVEVDLRKRRDAAAAGAIVLGHSRDADERRLHTLHPNGSRERLVLAATSMGLGSSPSLYIASIGRWISAGLTQACGSR